MFNLSDIVYRCYKPSTSVEMKEFLLFLLSQRLDKETHPYVRSVLGRGSFDSLSPKLRGYLEQRGTREARVLQEFGELTLLFNSMFESGNLEKAVKKGP